MGGLSRRAATRTSPSALNNPSPRFLLQHLQPQTCEDLREKSRCFALTDCQCGKPLTGPIVQTITIPHPHIHILTLRHPTPPFHSTPDVGDFQCIPANIGVKVKRASTRGDLSANGYFYTFHKESCQTEGTFNMLPCDPETETCYAVEPCESESMECCQLAPGYFQQSTEQPSTSQSELQLKS